MVSAINSALSGIASASRRIEDAATRIANSGNTNIEAAAPVSPVDAVTLSEDAEQVQNESQANDPTDAIIELKLASYDFKANLKTIQIQQNLDQALLDITA